MQWVVNIPDDVIEAFGVDLPPRELGLFEVNAVDAILADEPE